MFCGLEAQKVGSQKRRVWSHLGRCEMKNCWPLWREADLGVKMLKAPHSGTLLEVQMSKKCTPLWREGHFEDVEKVHTVVARSTFRSQKCKSMAVSGSDAVSRDRRNGFCNLPQVSQTCGFCSSCKNDGKCRRFEEDLHRWISCGKRVARDMFIRDVSRSGHFPEKCCILGHQIFRFAKMILRDGRSTSYDLASLVKLKN